MKNLFWPAIAIIFGITIAYIDTRPHWNDDGISVLMILVVSFFCSYFFAKKPWIIALTVGIWVPVFNIVLANNFGSLIAIIPAFIGAYAAYYITRLKVAAN